MISITESNGESPSPCYSPGYIINSRKIILHWVFSPVSIVKKTPKATKKSDQDFLR